MPRWTPFEPYFWSLVEKADGCWLWKGGTDGKGYARIWHEGRRVPASRVAYELVTGTKIPDHLYACHHCDNKKCVNPSHIFIGTPSDNMQDWTKKGKNRLVNDRSLWANGRYWKNNPKARKNLSNIRKAEFASGRRVIVHDENGRMMGTRMTEK